MRLAQVAFAVVAGLVLGSIAACSHGRCAPSGGAMSAPQCEGWGSAGCAKIPGCRFGTGCALKYSCETMDQATCESVGHCTWEGNGVCADTSNPCPSLSEATCAGDARCMQVPACIGTPVACETFDDPDECEADLACDWNSTPAF